MDRALQEDPTVAALQLKFKGVMGRGQDLRGPHRHTSANGGHEAHKR